MDELALGQRRRPAIGAEGAELLLQVTVQLVVAAAEVVPAGAVAGRQPREDGRQVGVLQLEGIARHDPHPGDA